MMPIRSVKRTDHHPQARPVARSPAAIQPGRFPSGLPGSSPGSCRFRKTKSAPLLDEVSAEFSQRHQQIRNLFLERFEQVREICCRPTRNSPKQRRLLIGSYFLAEYSLESAALFNPSIVPHPDQTGLAARRAAIHSQLARHRGRTHLLHHLSHRHHPSRSSDRSADPPPASSPSRVKSRTPVYEKALFARKLSELGLAGEFTRRVMNKLGESFALEELRASLQARSSSACRME